MVVPFCFPVKELQGERFRITPFDREKHVDALWSTEINSPAFLAHIPCGPWPSKEEFVEELIEDIFDKHCTRQLYIVLTTRTPRTTMSSQSYVETEVVAGICAYINASTVNSQVEVGYFMILPPFQGTGLAFAVGDLLTRNILTPASEGGLGLRRAVWQCNSTNIPSQRLALKLGYKQEALLRWDRVYHDGIAKGKIGNGRPVPPAANPGDLGRDTVMLGRCWDEI